MKHILHRSALRPACGAALVGLSLATAATAQQQLAVGTSGTSDAVISADQRSFEAVQARIEALNNGGRPLADHHLAKAQCWLDASFHEATRNDRGSFAQEALAQSERLVRAMEQRQQPLPADTPLVAGAVQLRADLWQRAAALRSHAGWSCAQARAACAEVELVHAGHEHAQLGWRHAKPYVQIAEDLVADAERQAGACALPGPAVVAAAPAVVTTPLQPPPPPPPTPPPPAAAAAPVAQPVTLSAQVVFAFDRSGIDALAGPGLAPLQSLLQQLRERRLELVSVALTGHADRLNGSRLGDYNQRLSERRVGAVRDWLLAQGIDAARIATLALGDRRPLHGCAAPAAGRALLQQCLQPNRRVDVQLVVRQP